jgi:hypothetical protein
MVYKNYLFYAMHVSHFTQRKQGGYMQENVFLIIDSEVDTH